MASYQHGLRKREAAKAKAEHKLRDIRDDIASMNPVDDADDIRMLTEEAQVIQDWLDDWPDNMQTPEQVYG